MGEKLYEYEGALGAYHRIKETAKETWENWKERRNVPKPFESGPGNDKEEETYNHIYRRKTRSELIRISAAVMGIEFSYAAETAFVSPTLLKIGVEHKHMTLVWALSPLVGFFLTPILGSISDGCRLQFGRRRPFIVLMSVGVLIGLLLVPNGEYLGYLAGDSIIQHNDSSDTPSAHRTTALKNSSIETQIAENNSVQYHPWGIFFTIVGTVLLDFDADACQSPARAYLLDVTVAEDHAKGLSTFTIMAGLGGFFGYATGGINWDATFIGTMLGGHVRAVFTLITFVFIICVSYTITSFQEIPLPLLENHCNYEFSKIQTDNEEASDEESTSITRHVDSTYGAIQKGSGNGQDNEEGAYSKQRQSISTAPNASLKMYLKSIFFMPSSLRFLCLTNLFCWMAHVCYSLYFTDFVGESVFNGDPSAPEDSQSRDLYEEGIRFGCWGMSMYSLSCACYSFVIERLIIKFGARTVYVGGLLVYSTGMFLMAMAKGKISVIVFSWTAGVMYSTLFTMPYLLIAHYHAKETFELTHEGTPVAVKQIRGLGTDVAVVSSMVFLAQFILSMCMGSIVTSAGTTTAVVSVASVLAFCGAISATQIMYLDL